MPSKNTVRITLLFIAIVVMAILAAVSNRDPDPSASSKKTTQISPSASPTPEDSHAHDHHRAAEASTGTNAIHTSAQHTTEDHGHTHLAVPKETLARIARENPQLAASSSTSSDGLKETPMPGGGVMFNFEGRFQTVAIATVGPDGKIGFTCVTDIDQHGSSATNGAARPATPVPKDR